MMLTKNKVVKVHSPDGDADYFVIVVGVQQGNTLAPYLYIICFHCVVQTSLDLMKENNFTLAKARGWRWSTQTITGVDNASDIHTSPGPIPAA